MKPINPRQRNILQALSTDGELSVAQLMERLKVSDMTVRRDLVHLEKLGRVERTWGGARVAEREVLEFSFRDKARLHEAEKEAIGTSAAAMVQDGQSVFLDTGTTTLWVARALRNRTNLTVFTCSLPTVAELIHREGITTIMLGGTVRSDSLEVYGPLTERNFAGIRADIAFLGVDAVGGDGELLTSGMETARVAELIAQVSRRKVLVADSSKWEASANMPYGTLTTVDAVVTDRGLSTARRKQCRTAGAELILAQRR